MDHTDVLPETEVTSCILSHWDLRSCLCTLLSDGYFSLKISWLRTPLQSADVHGPTPLPTLSTAQDPISAISLCPSKAATALVSSSPQSCPTWQWALLSQAHISAYVLSFLCPHSGSQCPVLRLSWLLLAALFPTGARQCSPQLQASRPEKLLIQEFHAHKIPYTVIFAYFAKPPYLVSVRSVIKWLSFSPHICDKTISCGGSNSPGWALLSWWELWCCSCHLNYLNSLMNNLVKGEKIPSDISICSIYIIILFFCYSATYWE